MLLIDEGRPSPTVGDTYSIKNKSSERDKRGEISVQEGKDEFIFICTIDFRNGETVCLSSMLISFQLMVCKLELKPEINLFLL